MIQKISFIGSGRVATHLAQALSAHVQIAQIYSRNIDNAQTLAHRVNAQAIADLNQLNTVDLLIIAVSDAEIAAVAASLKDIHYQGFVVHTSGSTHINVLKVQGLNAGVFYPLQTFSFEHAVDWKNTPVFIEAAVEKSQQDLILLAEMISECCYRYSSEQRLSLHLAAVFACNFTNHCYDVAQQILEQKQVDFKLLMPLILSTAHKLEHTSAYQNQTGPARRQDQNILNMHQNMLIDQPQWQQIYQLMSDSILQRFN